MSLNINGDYQIIELIKRIKEEKRNTIGTLELHPRNVKIVVRWQYQGYEETFKGVIKFQNKTFTWDTTALSLKHGFAINELLGF